VRDRGGNGSEEWLVGDPVDGDRQAAAPVRRLVDGAGHVGLVGEPQQVFELECGEPAGRLCEEAVHGDGETTSTPVGEAASATVDP